MAAAEGLKAGLHRRASCATLRATGADRIDYLHRMLTQDLRGLAPGAATYACLLTPKGRILGDLLLWHGGDHVLLETDAAALDAVQPVLERYVIADDVVFEDVSARRARYVLFGAGAPAALAAAGLEAPPPASFCAVEVGGRQAAVLRFDRRGLVAFELAVAPGAAAELEERLGLDDDPAAYAACCVRHGVPRFGTELGADVLFNEAGLEEAVSWNKGCYPGQEPVVMARHRGHPPRRLVGLALEGATLPAPGADVLADGAVVGHVTSAAPGEGGPGAALAFVKRSAAEAGRVFDVAGCGPATAHPLAGEEV